VTEQLRRTAVLWSATEASIRYACQFGVVIALARWLKPAEFGINALMTVLVAFATLFVDGGLGNALIQRPDHSTEDECTVFWFSLSAAVGTATALILASGWIAGFFAEPQLAPLSWVAGAIIIIGALQCVPTALASKRLDFRSQAHASLIAVVASGALALWLARRGAGVWALAWQTLAMTVLQTLVLWLKVKWRPRILFSSDSLRRLFRFGGFVTLANLIDAAVSRLHLVLIGRFYASADLGQFARAASTRDGPQSALAGMFTRVAFPVFASQAAEPALLRLSLRRAVVAMMALNIPAMAGLCLLASLLVPVAFGPNWGRSIPLLQILCLAGALWPLQVANVQALLAQGNSRLLFRIELLKKGLLVIVTVIASLRSLEAVAWGLVLCSFAGHAINAHYSGKFLKYGYLEQVRDVLPYAGLTILMIIGLLGLGALLPAQSDVARLATLIAAGAGAYAFALRVSGLVAWNLLRSIIPNRQSSSAPGT
jgi:teichuronic acid exporter